MEFVLYFHVALKNLRRLDIRDCEFISYETTVGILKGAHFALYVTCTFRGCPSDLAWIGLDDLEHIEHDPHHLNSNAYPTVFHYLDDSSDSDVEQEKFDKTVEFRTNYAKPFYSWRS